MFFYLSKLTEIKISFLNQIFCYEISKKKHWQSDKTSLLVAMNIQI